MFLAEPGSKTNEMTNPFAKVHSPRPGTGEIYLALLPPNTPRLKTLRYTYPLKLVSPSPLLTSETNHTVHTVYLLSYGGGLVAGDAIDLSITIDPSTRLILLTQGSTKIFKSPSPSTISKQHLDFSIHPDAALCYLPDPVQPFAGSSLEQRQIFNIHLKENLEKGSLCVLDWVSNGRPANGENWSFRRYASRNEFYLVSESETKRLLLRDSLVLDDKEGIVAERVDGLGCFGSLILWGEVFEQLGRFCLEEFHALPRIGGRKWDDEENDGNHEENGYELAGRNEILVRRKERQKLERECGVLWSVASVRGCTVVKFGATKVEGGRLWLGAMLKDEGSAIKEFGERVLLSFK